MIPIFIFSLPRSGSTLLQRILAASGQISTAAEPWILLPYVYTLKSDGVISEYWHSHVFGAIEDFYQGFPGGKNDYLDELRSFILNLYKKGANPESQYFLDKTPRYHLICEEIIKLFPDGKFIFLWRNPLAVVSSIIQRWTGGKWSIMTYDIDLYKGINNMLNTFSTNKSRVYTIKYEDLVQQPSEEVKKICDYLGLEYNEQMILSFYNTHLNGRMAENTGSQIYKNKLSKGSLDIWKNTFNNPYRRYWAKNYLTWIGKERLEIMGYDYDELKAELLKNKSLSINLLFSDLIRTIFLKCKILLSPLSVHTHRGMKNLFR
jgi:hypothetical protein